MKQVKPLLVSRKWLEVVDIDLFLICEPPHMQLLSIAHWKHLSWRDILSSGTQSTIWGNSDDAGVPNTMLVFFWLFLLLAPRSHEAFEMKSNRIVCKACAFDVITRLFAALVSRSQFCVDRMIDYRPIRKRMDGQPPS